MKNKSPKRLRDILEASVPRAPTSPITKSFSTDKPIFKHDEDPHYQDIQRQRQKTPQNDVIGQEIADQQEKDFRRNPAKELTKKLNQPAYSETYKKNNVLDYDVDTYVKQKDAGPKGRDM